MNPKEKILAEKIIDFFKNSVKTHLIPHNDFPETIFKDSLLQKTLSILIDYGIIENKGKGVLKLTKKGLNFTNFVDFEIKENIEFEKSILDIKLKKWQLKTFWWIFAFAIIGSVLSFCNLINNQKNQANLILKEQQIEQMELEVKKLHNLILDQKKDDSLRNSKVLTNKNNK